MLNEYDSLIIEEGEEEDEEEEENEQPKVQESTNNNNVNESNDIAVKADTIDEEEEKVAEKEENPGDNIASLDENENNSERVNVENNDTKDEETKFESNQEVAEKESKSADNLNKYDSKEDEETIETESKNMNQNKSDSKDKETKSFSNEEMTKSTFINDDHENKYEIKDEKSQNESTQEMTENESKKGNQSKSAPISINEKRLMKKKSSLSMMLDKCSRIKFISLTGEVREYQLDVIIESYTELQYYIAKYNPKSKKMFVVQDSSGKKLSPLHFSKQDFYRVKETSIKPNEDYINKLGVYWEEKAYPLELSKTNF